MAVLDNNYLNQQQQNYDPLIRSTSANFQKVVGRDVRLATLRKEFQSLGRLTKEVPSLTSFVLQALQTFISN